MVYSQKYNKTLNPPNFPQFLTFVAAGLPIGTAYYPGTRYAGFAGATHSATA